MKDINIDDFKISSPINIKDLQTSFDLETKKKKIVRTLIWS